MATTSLLFILLYVSGLLLAIFRNAQFGLYVYIAVFYLDAPNRWWGADLPQLRWSFIAAAVTALAAIIHSKDRTRWVRFVPVQMLILYTVWMFVQSSWALDPIAHADGLQLFTKYIIVVFMIITIVDDEAKMRRFMMANAIGGLYLGIIALSSYSGGRLDGVGGPGINDANSLGMQLSAVSLLAGAAYFSAVGSMRWAAAATLPFMLNAIVMSGSRGAFLGLVLGAVTFFLLRPKRKSGLLFLYGVAALGVFLYLAQDTFWERMTSITDAAMQTEQMDHSAESRWGTIEAQLRMFRDYPLGGGHRTTTVLSKDYIDERYLSETAGVRSSHNTFMSTLVDQGVIGLTLWVLIAWFLYRYSVRTRKALPASRIGLTWMNAGIAGGLVVVLTAGMFAPYLRAEVYIWLLALMCVMYGISQRLPQDEAKPADRGKARSLRGRRKRKLIHEGQSTAR